MSEPLHVPTVQMSGVKIDHRRDCGCSTCRPATPSPNDRELRQLDDRYLAPLQVVESSVRVMYERLCELEESRPGDASPVAGELRGRFESLEAKFADLDRRVEILVELDRRVDELEAARVPSRLAPAPAYEPLERIVRELRRALAALAHPDRGWPELWIADVYEQSRRLVPDVDGGTNGRE